jgi:hypothetical protein
MTIERIKLPRLISQRLRQTARARRRQESKTGHITADGQEKDPPLAHHRCATRLDPAP